MKKMKTINSIIILVMLLLDLVYLVGTMLGYFSSNILVCLSLIVIVFAPRIIRKLFKIKVSNTTELLFMVFIFLAQLLGSVMGFYNLIYWFDSFVHFLSGVFTAYLGLLLLKYFKKYDKKKILFNVLYILSTTLMVAALWEIFEFTADNLLGGNAQRVIETGVADTMKDIICAVLGSILLIVTYLFNKEKFEDK